MWLEHSKGVGEKGKKDRKFSSTCGTQTHNLLLSGQAHYHCAKVEAANGRRRKSGHSVLGGLGVSVVLIAVFIAFCYELHV